MTDTSILVQELSERTDINLSFVDNQLIDIERIITEDGPTAHIDFAIYLIQCQYRKIIKAIEKVDGKGVTRAMKERALLHARQRTFEWLLTQGKGLIDRTTGFLFEEADRTGWFRSDYFSWNEIEDMVASVVDQTEDDSSEHWAWLTFAKKIIPAAKASGIETGLLLSSAHQVRKLRHQLVPAWNELHNRMETGATSVEQGEKEFRWLLELTANPNIKSSEMKEVVDEWRGKEVKAPEPLIGLSAIINNDETIHLVVTKNRVESHMVENALRNKVDFDVVGLKTFLQITTKLIGLERMSRLFDETIRNTNNSGGDA